MSEEDLELLITLDDPRDAQEEDTFNHLQAENTLEAVSNNDAYKVAFGQGDWTCTLSRFAGTTNDSMKGLDGNIIQPTRARVAIDAPLGTATYARMFPELPSFEADEAIPARARPRRRSLRLRRHRGIGAGDEARTRNFQLGN